MTRDVQGTVKQLRKLAKLSHKLNYETHPNWIAADIIEQQQYEMTELLNGLRPLLILAKDTDHQGVIEDFPALKKLKETMDRLKLEISA